MKRVYQRMKNEAAYGYEARPPAHNKPIRASLHASYQRVLHIGKKPILHFSLK